MTLHNDTKSKKKKRKEMTWERYSFLFCPVEVEKGTKGSYEHNGIWYKDKNEQKFYGKPYFGSVVNLEWL